MYLGKLKAIVKHISSSGPEKDVPWRWLFRTGSRMDRRFAQSAKYTLDIYGKYWQLEYENELFLWPRSASIATLLMIISELMTSNHPHQYLCGPTQLSPEDVVLDIGACEGAFAAYATTQCKRVIAVEPSRSMCALMKDLFDLRGEPLPLILNCLLGDKNSSAYFLETERNPAANAIINDSVPGSYEIPVLTLDHVFESLQEKPTFIKCDAEGAEVDIFSSGRNVLRRYRPKLAITTYHKPSDYRELYNLLTSLGYNVRGKGFLFAHDRLLVQMIHAW